MNVLACVCVDVAHGRRHVLARIFLYLSSMPRAGALLSAASGFNKFFDIISKTARFSEERY
jgi:hypothetical protein